MADEKPLAPPSPRAQLIVRDVDASVNYSVNTTVTDITERAAKSALDIALATHVTPKRVVMIGTIIGTAIIGLLTVAILWMTYTWSLPPAVVVAALVVIGVPFGIVALRVLPKLVGQVAAP